MSKKIPVDSYKGVRDFYPEDQAFQQYLAATYRAVCERFGYVEYHASILEPSDLYKAKGADNEEIVSEQTYTFTDRGGREVTLRPEMTPTVARMVAAKRRELGFPLRLFSIPNVFRYERPQRGRLREHWQLNVDLFGSESFAADAEVISVLHTLMKTLGASDSDFVIKLGSRAALDALVAELGLSDENAKALRIVLDRRDKMEPVEFNMALEALGVPPGRLGGHEVPPDVAAVLALLTDLGVTNAVYDPGIVRGFEYYTGVVFEVFDLHPDNNRAVCGGGRYSNLTQLFDDEQVPGVGFGLGDVTIRDFLSVRGLLPPYVPPTKAYVAVAEPESVIDALGLARELREQGVAVAVDFGEKKLGDQIKAASKHRIPWLIVVGPNEVASGSYTVKNLESGAQETVPREQLADFFLTQ